MASVEQFWDRVAHRYAARPIGDMQSYDQTMERTRARLAPADRVLELGCGTGTTALRLADAVNHLTATDLSAEMIQIARDKALAEGVTNVSFRHAALRDAAGGERFDAVLAFNLLHLLPDLSGDLAAIHEMVKPGGLFISKSACLSGRGLHLRLLLGALRLLGKAPHIRFLRADALEDTIRAAGFEIIETHRFPGVAAARFIVAHRR